MGIMISTLSCENDITEIREMAVRTVNTETGTNIDSYLSLEG